ncbi:MAG: GGDEF domain-containing protein [Flavobacteriales bacterium]|jgi:GGDEF domain-containing protein
MLSDYDVVHLDSALLKYFSTSKIDRVIDEETYQMESIDGHTQIFDEQCVLNAIDLEFSISSESSQPLSILYYHLDLFKRIRN